MSSDKFGTLFDEYQAKKRAVNEKALVLSTPEGELPLWRDVKDSGQNNVYIICRKEFKESDIVENCIICKVYFHFKELRQWVKTSQTCPSCKNEEF
ncbi:MAG: RING finger domain-containing protein [Candidatus Kariarchaeaceae archaeon]|jgi:hypothetical protein